MRSNSALIAAAVAAGLVIWEVLRRRSWIDLRGKRVLITGGSRGLGLQTAREFGSRGASVVICARDVDELERAQEDLLSKGVDARSFVCDVSDQAQVQAMIAKLGRVDVLVNNAGVIEVGPFESMEVADFQKAMNVIFWGSLHMTLAVLPSMRAAGRGSIVNITSIGGKVSVPHLLPYCCAKFALAGLSEGLRTELAPAGIRVTTVAPGLLRTGSHINADFKGDQSKEYAWFAAGAASPVISISAERAARSIVEATIRGTSEKVLSVPADVLAKVHGLLPNLTAIVLDMANSLLPEGDGGSGPRQGSGIEAGFQSALWKLFTAPGRSAAETLNEVG